MGKASPSSLLVQKQSDNASQARKRPTCHYYFLLQLFDWLIYTIFLKKQKSSHDDEFKPSCDNGKKVDEDPRKHSKCNDQEKEDNVNSTNNINATSTNKVNAVGYTQEEGINYDELFAPVARIEANWLFLGQCWFIDVLTSPRPDISLPCVPVLDTSPYTDSDYAGAQDCTKITAWNKFSSTMASAIICLATNQKFSFSKFIFEAPSSSSKQKSVPHSEQPAKEVPILEDVNISDLEDTDTAHLPKIKTRPDWLKHVPEEDIPKTPETDWIIPPNDLPDIENN
ncbi:hypothetical protein Tco_0794682 [Tanacetum coccineum]